MSATLHVRDTGEGEPVLLLHGWPDTGTLWRHQVRALVDAGYRVIVPDLRGFGASDKPADAEEYGPGPILGDIMGILERFSLNRVHVVGHDWGAAIGWISAGVYADRVASLTALSVGHPSAFRAAGFEQREKSWYMLLFQFPEAEQWLSADDFANFREWSRHPDADEVVRRLSAPGALSASLNVYRAIAHPRTLIEPPPQLPPVQAPTMGVWSTGDFALLERQMTSSKAHVLGPWRYERLEGPGHWMQLEAPDKVNGLLLDFLRDHPIT
jgi:pimeloyl-ACP methyl ester carboxylesterase